MATDPNSSVGYEQALAIATSTFFVPLLFTPEDHETHFGVEFDKGAEISTLYLSAKPPNLVVYLLKNGVGPKEAWLFALRHETAHIELNMKCFDQKLSPPNPNDQLAVLEIPLTIFDKIAIPQHHKESAIEAFCDVTAVQYLRDNFHATWATTATHIANYRKIQFDIKNSSTAADYFTHLAIFHFIEAPASVTPLSAAKKTYTESKSRAKIMENAKMVMSEHIDDAIASINVTRKFLATKLKNTRLAKLFHHGKPPPPKP